MEISLKQPNQTCDDLKFEPVISQQLVRVFEMLTLLHKAFIAEYGSKLKVGVTESLIYNHKILEERATNDELVKVYESIMFFRKAFYILLHNEPTVFHQFLQSCAPKNYDRPLWSQYPHVNSLYSCSSSYADENLPSPKLQWIAQILTKIPKDKRILILAEGSGTVSMICNFLAGFTPRTNGEGIEIPLDLNADEEPLIDPSIFGIIEQQLILLEELHAQANILEKFQPDYVIFWDVTLLSLRRLEIYNSRFHKSVVAYLLSYKESSEYELMKYTSKHENEIFIKCIKDVKTISLSPLVPYPNGSRPIIVDEREFRSSLPIALVQVGFKVIPALITVGDYVLSDEFVIERKAYSDLVGSLKSGRLLQQLQRMKNYYKKPLLLIEFSETDQFNLISAKDKNPVVMQKLMVILRCFPDIKVIWARNNLEAAKTLFDLSEGKTPPDLTQALSAGIVDKNSLQNSSRAVKFLSAIPFLTNEHINKITANCKNIKKLVKMSREDLMNLLEPSIGIKLYSLLHFSTKKE